LQKLRKYLIGLFGGIFGISAASAAVPVALIAGAAALLGAIVYRSFVPTDTAAAFEFFNTCWSCNLFSSVVNGLSTLAANTYSYLSEFIIFLAIGLTPIFVAWRLLKPMLDGSASAGLSPWAMGGGIGTHLIKLTFVIGLMWLPIPQILTTAVIEPAFNIGLSFQQVITEKTNETNTDFETCLVASAAIENPNYNTGIFSTGFKNKIRCSIASVQSLTAIGMTSGWLLFNSAFDSSHMYKIANTIPIFPNIEMLLIGMLLIVVFFWMIIPFVLSFLQYLFKFIIDMVFLPLSFIGWLFKGNKFIKTTEKDIMKIITETMESALAMALLCIFIGFCILLCGYIFTSGSFAAIGAALQNNTAYELLTNGGNIIANKDIWTVALFGLFLAIFTTSITKMINEFISFKVDDSFLSDAAAWYKHTTGTVKKYYKNVNGMLTAKKEAKDATNNSSNNGGGNGNGN
jgi:hypothetical protein